MAEVMTVIPKTYDLLVWLLPTLAKFPRDQKFLLGDRLQTGLMDLLGLLIEANYTRDRAQILRRANIELEKFRFLNPKPQQQQPEQPQQQYRLSLCENPSSLSREVRGPLGGALDGSGRFPAGAAGASARRDVGPGRGSGEVASLGGGAAAE
jgi:hypothetical protein